MLSFDSPSEPVSVIKALFPVIQVAENKDEKFTFAEGIHLSTYHET